MFATITSNSDIDIDVAFDEFNQRMSRMWQEEISNSQLTKAVSNGELDKYLYAIYMIETYHYVSHNAANQALVGVRMHQDSAYTKYCFKHAYEETGHEKMALHDLSSMGFDKSKIVTSKPLPETETLIAYLYWICSNGNPLRRLGFSYWAENSSEYLNPLMGKIKNTLNLDKNQMTFFIAHSEIDEKHSEEVKSIISRTCKNINDWKDMVTVAETSMRLANFMTEAVYREYCLFMQGKSERYSFLNDIIMNEG